MARDYDTQLLESVSVRRRRLRDALLFGRLRSRRTLDEGVTKLMAGVCVAAVLCAGSAGWSFVRKQGGLRRVQAGGAGPGNLPKAPAATTPPPSPTLGGAETWGGRQVTLAMLDTALVQAGTPATLYSLPAVHRSTTDGRYFLLRRGSRWIAGIAERGDERTGPGFGTEDGACRWFYNELVFAEPSPVHLSAAEDRQARQHGAAIVQSVEALLHPSPAPTPAKTAPAKTGAPKRGRKPSPKPSPPPTSVVITLPRDTVVDLGGEEGGSYLSPDGSAAGFGAQRFQVTRAFHVRAGASMAQPGTVELRVEPGLLGDATRLPSVRWLLHYGYLRPVATI